MKHECYYSRAKARRSCSCCLAAETTITDLRRQLDDKTQIIVEKRGHLMAADALIETVIALHRPSKVWSHGLLRENGVCADCGQSLPCPTLRAAEGK